MDFEIQRYVWEYMGVTARAAVRVVPHIAQETQFCYCSSRLRGTECTECGHSFSA
jgi:hypothetical protein